MSITQNILKKLFCPIDINEDNLYNIYPELLKILLKDMTTGKNIIWATDDYIKYGTDYEPEKEITPQLITGKNVGMIKPRVKKSRTERERRTKEKAEVFTPSWVCNKQNNLVDNEWFGTEYVFNSEIFKTWRIKTKKIRFKNGKNWKNYVNATRMEITCGEAPYLASRYDTVTGKRISINRRIGLLDRKMRIIKENVRTRRQWIYWAEKAYKNIYGFEFQGDNVLLAREALLASFYEYYTDMGFESPLKIKEVLKIAEIISWNIWQMDGLSFMAPFEKERADKERIAEKEYDRQHKSDLFNDFSEEEKPDFNTEYKYSLIFDWEEKKSVEFKSLVKKDN